MTGRVSWQLVATTMSVCSAQLTPVCRWQRLRVLSVLSVQQSNMSALLLGFA